MRSSVATKVNGGISLHWDWNRKDSESIPASAVSTRAKTPKACTATYLGQKLMVDGDIVNSADISRSRFPRENPNVLRRGVASLQGLIRQAQRIQTEAQVFYFAFRHPRVRWYARLVAACTAAYLFSPIQLIPSFIPVIGFLDDLLVLFVGVKLVQKLISPDVLAECRKLAEDAEMRRREEIRSAAAVAGSIAIVSLWLLAAVGGGALMMTYIRR
jgi:uncharacterized membrane protein YkvA (DUF1232 family)